MNRLLSLWHRCGVLGAASLALLAALPAPSAAQSADKKKRDANAARYVKQLTARYQAWDTNGDNKLDKKELAVAFRGAGAKPFDYAPPTPWQKSRLLMVALTGRPTYLLLVNQTLAGVVALPRLTRARTFLATTGSPAANPNTLPDYQFLILAGNTGSTTLSRGEFDSWARNFAGAVADQDYYKRLVQSAQAKANKAKKGKSKQAKQAAQAAQAEVQRYQQNLQDANARVSAVPQAVQQAFALKR